MTVRVAAVQAAPVWLDTGATVERASELIREAGAAGAELVAFPEAYVPGYPYWNWIMDPFDGSAFFHQLADQALLVPGPHTRALCAQARHSAVHVVIGITERSPVSVGTLYNTTLVVGPDGRLLGRHRKLVPTWAEKLTWTGGDGSSLVTYDTELGRIGTLACGENTNTLARFALLAQGEQIHVAGYPAFPFNSYNMARAIELRAGAHSFEGKVFTVVASSVLTKEIIDAVCRTDQQRAMMTNTPNAYSAVFAPTGEVIGDPLIDSEGILYRDIDLGQCVELKQMHDIVGGYNRFDVFALTVDRRPQAPLAFVPDVSRHSATNGGSPLRAPSEGGVSSIEASTSGRFEANIDRNAGAE